MRRQHSPLENAAVSEAGNMIQSASCLRVTISDAERHYTVLVVSLYARAVRIRPGSIAPVSSPAMAPSQ